MTNERIVQDTFTAHGVLNSVAWAVLAPLGAILIRVVPSSKAWVVHAGVMLFALSLFTSGAGVGIWRTLKDGYTIGGTYHSLLGVIILALVWSQPITGLVHHLSFKRLNKRVLVSAIHVFFGRILILVSLINGGLGLLLNGTTTKAQNVAYGVVVGSIWVGYIIVSFTYEIKKDNRFGGEVSEIQSERSKSPSLAMLQENGKPA